MCYCAAIPTICVGGTKVAELGCVVFRFAVVQKPFREIAETKSLKFEFAGMANVAVLVVDGGVEIYVMTISENGHDIGPSGKPRKFSRPKEAPRTLLGARFPASSIPRAASQQSSRTRPASLFRRACAIRA